MLFRSDWRGVWKLIELEGTRLIKYAAYVIAFPQQDIGIFAAIKEA